MTNDSKTCVRCGYQGDELERAHLLSHYLAKVIVIQQIFEPKTDEQHRTIDELVDAIRNRPRGEVYLCKPCHQYSDNQQKLIEEALRNLLEEKQK